MKQDQQVSWAHGVDFVRVADASGLDSPLPYSVTLPVLGIVTRFESNSRAVIELVEESYGVWRALDRATDSEPVRVRVVVAGGEEAGAVGEHVPIRHLSPGEGRFSARSVASVAESDPGERLVKAFVTTALVADRAHFRGELLEAATLALLSELDRHPVHAAGVASGGRAVLLAAPSGTGKSTLAYLCYTAGLDLMSDDLVWVQLRPEIRIWGSPVRVRLLPRVQEQIQPTRAEMWGDEASGDVSKRAIDVRAGATESRLVASDFTVCVLARDGGRASLERLVPAELAHALEQQMAPGFDRFPERWPAVRDVLVARGGWRLHLSDDVHDALPLVRRVLADGGVVT